MLQIKKTIPRRTRAVLIPLAVAGVLALMTAPPSLASADDQERPRRPRVERSTSQKAPSRSTSSSRSSSNRPSASPPPSSPPPSPPPPSAPPPSARPSSSGDYGKDRGTTARPPSDYGRVPERTGDRGRGWNESSPDAGRRYDRPPGSYSSPPRDDHDRGRDRDHHHGHSGGYYGGSSGYGLGFGYGYDGFYGHLGYGYSYPHYASRSRLSHYRPYRYYYPSFYSYFGFYPFYNYRYYEPVRTVEIYAGDPQGALDLNIKPKDAEVYLDGRLVGNVDQFDGWPRYLWVEEGSHELIIYRPGYETLVRVLEVDRYDILRLRARLVRGEAIAPEKLTQARPPSYPPPIEQARTVPYSPPSSPSYGAPPPSYAPSPPYSPPASAPPGTLDTRADPGRIYLEIVPPDSAVYLDGGFLGVGSDLGDLRYGLLVNPGEHVLQVIHPNYPPRELRFSVSPGSEQHLKVDSPHG